MKAWIFQSTSDRYDLRETKVLSAGRRATWLATRFRQGMAPGDLVFFWLAGDPEIRGIYGWGHLLTKAYVDNTDDSFGVDVVCDRRLAQHVPVDRIKAAAQLGDLLVLRAPQATNFPLTDEETRALIRLLPQDDRPEFRP
jgi:predicted RNA-binding protein with PUA-like domain